MMKKLWMLLLVILIVPLLSGCEIWLFLEDGGGGASGIDVYADIRSNPNNIDDVLSGQYMTAALFREQGTNAYVRIETKKAEAGSEIIDASFSDVETDDYILVVWLDGDGDGDFNSSDYGFTSSPFFHPSGSYDQFILDSTGDWDDGDVEEPS